MTSQLVVVEDSDDDFEAFERTCRAVGFAGTITRFVDAEVALAHLEAESEKPLVLPSLLLLDLNLPGMDGRELLARMKEHPTLRVIPVVVLTTSSNDADLRYCYRHHANGYQLKPMSLERLETDVRVLVEYWFETVVLPTRGGA